LGGSAKAIIGTVVERAGKPALAGGAALAALAGSVAVGKKLKPKRRKFNLGPVTLPKVGPGSLPKVHVKTPKDLDLDLDSVAGGLSKAGKRVGRTGEQLGKLAIDIQRAGETTERVGKILAK
jgi:hypothetical protein